MPAPEMELRRPQEAAPTVEGWYYGRPIDWSVEPYPCQVDKSLHVLDGTNEPDMVGDYDWFGKVPTCVESKGIENGNGN